MRAEGDAAPLGDTDVLLLDLDGVVYVGRSAVPNAVETLTTVRGRGVTVGYITNNASRRPAGHGRSLHLPTKWRSSSCSQESFACGLFVAEVFSRNAVFI